MLLATAAGCFLALVTIWQGLGKCRVTIGKLSASRIDRPAASVSAVEAIQAAAQSDDPNATDKILEPVELALADLPELLVSQSDAASLARGQSVLIRGRDAPILEGPAFATSKGRLIALGELDKGALHPTRVFNLG